MKSQRGRRYVFYLQLSLSKSPREAGSPYLFSFPRAVYFFHFLFSSSSMSFYAPIPQLYLQKLNNMFQKLVDLQLSSAALL